MEATRGKGWAVAYWMFTWCSDAAWINVLWAFLSVNGLIIVLEATLIICLQQNSHIDFDRSLIKSTISTTKFKQRILRTLFHLFKKNSPLQFQLADILSFHSILQTHTYAGKDCDAKLVCLMPRRDCFSLCTERWKAERLWGICLRGTDRCWQYGIHSKCKWEAFRSALAR